MKEILIIFDLDETLIYSTRELPDHPEDFKTGDYFVFKRQFLDSVLVTLSRYFFLAIWSAGTKEYVNSIAEKINPASVHFEFIWTRENCTPHFDPDYNDRFYLKKIDKVKKSGFHKEKILIIEDVYHNVRQNYGNAIIVKQFRGGDDNELLLLCDYLLSLKDTQNVLTIEKLNWHSKINNINLQ